MVPSLSLEVKWLRQKLLKWFSNNGRTFPWRETDDPYLMLVAELMLARTKALQVEPVYTRFIEIFPTLKHLHDADIENIKGILHPLGLTNRYKNFKDISEIIYNKHKGRIPLNLDKLLELPSVGNYTAGMLRSIYLNKQGVIVDTNVVRLYVRFFNLKTVKEARRDKQIVNIARYYSKSTKPRSSSYAIIDFPAIVCTSSNPKCLICPIRNRCKSRMFITA